MSNCGPGMPAFECDTNARVQVTKTRYGSNPTHSPAPEAAASTSSPIALATKLPDTPVAFKLRFDRPFAFAIVDKLEGRAVVFGELQKPGRPGKDPGSRRKQGAASGGASASGGTPSTAARPDTGGWGGAAGESGAENSVLGSWAGSQTGHRVPTSGGVQHTAESGYLTAASGGHPIQGLTQQERLHTAWGVGTPVEVSFGGNVRAQAHRATIVAVNPDGSYDVRWVDSGEVHKFVSRQFIRAVAAVGELPATASSGRPVTTHTVAGDTYKVGAPIEVSYDAGKSWTKGFVAKVKGNGTMDVAHDDAATDIEHDVPLEWVRPRGRHSTSRSHSRRRSSARKQHARGGHAGAGSGAGSGAPPALGDPVEVDDQVCSQFCSSVELGCGVAADLVFAFVLSSNEEPCIWDGLCP